MTDGKLISLLGTPMPISKQLLTVLLAEDDDNDVILIRRAFERLGLIRRLVAVADGEQIIPYLRAEGKYADRQSFPFPDLLLLDHRMPRLSGLDVLYWLRTEPRFERLPVLVLSNGLTPDESDLVKQLNAATTLKTVEFADLPPALEQGITTALQIVQATRPSS